MRDPSIHIRETILTQELQKLSAKYNLSKQQSKTLAKDLTIACRQYSATHRSFNITNEKLLKKTSKVTTTGLKGAMLFAKILNMHRTKLRHVGVTILTPADKDWPQLKQVVSLADQFNIEFELKEKEGYTQYIKLGINKMKKFMINKMPSLHASICSEYEAIMKINEDKTPSQTREAYVLYSGIVSDKTGMPNIGYDKYPEKYVTFVTIKNEAMKLNIPIKTYIVAQFEAFSFRDGVPDPLQMIGEKAHSRVIKYCYEHNINLRSKPAINFKQIKNDANPGN